MNRRWAALMAKMLQVSLLGFAVGGAFLSLVYFDVPYYLMVCMMALRNVVRHAVQAAPQDSREAEVEQRELGNHTKTA